MKKYFVVIFSVLAISAYSQKSNDKGWTQMFNGKNLEGWIVKIEGYAMNDNFANTFRVENGLLKVSYDGYGGLLNNRYGHIFYKKKYSAYLVVVEYRFYGNQTKDGAKWAYLNNGIMLACQSPQSMMLKQDYPISIECQLLGSDSAVSNTNANVCTPGTNVEMNNQLVPQHCTGSTSGPSPRGEWTHVEALVLGDSLIKHIVGTDTVLVYGKPTIGGGVVNNYDSAVKKDGQLLKDGYIALQSESMPTEFRKVEVFDLGPYMHDPVKLAAVIKMLQHRNDKW